MKGVLVECDPAMKQFLLHLDDTKQLGRTFILQNLDDTHLFIDQDIIPILQTKIDGLMDKLYFSVLNEWVGPVSGQAFGLSIEYSYSLCLKLNKAMESKTGTASPQNPANNNPKSTHLPSSTTQHPPSPLPNLELPSGCLRASFSSEASSSSGRRKVFEDEALTDNTLGRGLGPAYCYACNVMWPPTSDLPVILQSGHPLSSPFPHPLKKGKYLPNFHYIHANWFGRM